MDFASIFCLKSGKVPAPVLGYISIPTETRPETGLAMESSHRLHLLAPQKEYEVARQVALPRR
jgi:hypothetical protein